jgi:rubrerythrin
MSRFTKRDKYGHAYTNETIYDRGMTSEDGVHFEKHYFENGTSAYDGKPIDRLCELEDKIEQGDVVEVRHGKWEYLWFDAVCSECGYINKADTITRCRNDPPYCPNCGAKMDGERRDQSEG